MTTRPAISIVTIAWRNEQFAPGFVSSLARAWAVSGEAGPELVVVANGPQGEQAAAAAGRVAGDEGVPVSVLRVDTNTGFSGGANAGVGRASGDVIVVANLDLTFDERFLEVLGREAAGTDPSWDLLAPRVTQGDHHVEAGVSHRTRSHRLAWTAPAPERAGPVGAGNGACIVLRRSALERRQAAAGALFDPECHSFNEDIDLFWWADRAGLVVRYVPDLWVDHALAGSFGGDHRFVARPIEVQRRVMANYRVTVWKNALGLVDWLGWPAGEAAYLAQIVRSRGLAGVGAYAASWRDAIETGRGIRSRRGRLRPAPSRSR